MRIDLQQQLFEKYPLSLRRGTSRAQPDPIDHWGIECGDGWHAIIDRALALMEPEIAKMRDAGVSKRSWPKVGQLKEKFGGLRLYIRNSHKLLSDIDAQLNALELQAQVTCERCGVTGELRHTGGYIHVSCNTCETYSPVEQPTDTDEHFAALRKVLRARQKC